MQQIPVSPPSAYRGGTGEPIVLIHGGGGHWRQWKPVIPLLEPHHEVLAVNLTGHWGGPPLPDGAEPSIGSLVDGVERDMDAAGWSSAHVAGTSLGGWVALELAKRGRARTCTAMAPAGGWAKGGGLGWRGDLGLRLVARSYGFFNGVTRLMARDPGRWSRRPGIRRLVFWHHFARTERMDPVDTAHLIVGMAHCTILPGLIAWARDHEGASALEQISCPTQLLFPAKDRVLPRRTFGERLVAAMPNAEVRDLPEVGHVATWDDPHLVARAILDFTSRHGP